MQEEQNKEQQAYYDKWTLERMENAKHGDTDHHSHGKHWDSHWGMTVGQLISRLSSYPPNQPIVIRRDVGWTGMSNFDIEVDEVIVRAHGGDDYDSCREEMKKGKMDTIHVVALMCEGYNVVNLYAHEVEEDYTEE